MRMKRNGWKDARKMLSYRNICYMSYFNVEYHAGNTYVLFQGIGTKEATWWFLSFLDIGKFVRAR